jgi:hypothetical protein
MRHRGSTFFIESNSPQFVDQYGLFFRKTEAVSHRVIQDRIETPRNPCLRNSFYRSRILFGWASYKVVTCERHTERACCHLRCAELFS